MRVSVLIPTRRPGPYLLEAIASAEAQAGAEVIVEPDHDGTGLSATVNRAALRASGEALTVLPDDDYYVTPDALAALVDTLTADPEAAAAYSLPQYVAADGTPLPTPVGVTRWAKAHPVVTWDTLADGLRMHGVGVLYRRDWWERVGPWDEALPCCEEWEFHLRLLSQGARIVRCPVVTVAYRRHAAQKSRRGGPIGRRSTARLAVRRQIRERYMTLKAVA